MICKAGRVSVSASPFNVTSLNKHMFVVTVPDTMYHQKITKYAAGPQMKKNYTSPCRDDILLYKIKNDTSIFYNIIVPKRFLVERLVYIYSTCGQNLLPQCTENRFPKVGDITLLPLEIPLFPVAIDISNHH